MAESTGKIEVLHGDITKLKVDAIVNAANRSLLGGGGVDGAIHRAAGPWLVEDCKKLNGCNTGQAKITKGYNLPSNYVIHTVGPVWNGGMYDEENLLKSCYVNCLKLATEHQMTSVAFPNISTGIYRFPKEKAARIAVAEVKAFLAKDSIIERVIFVCFDSENFDIYQFLL
jgi:O-acetyl-ADP-ribose deacetylase